MKSIFLFFVGFFLTATAHAVCPDKVWYHKNTGVQERSFLDGNCFANIFYRYARGMVYRGFLMVDEGQLMIFNSYGEGPESTHTGARVLFFFPRKMDLFKTRVVDENQVGVQMSNGDELVYSAETAELASSKFGQVVIDPKIHRENQGGVEIKNYQGFTLDAGFAMGHSPLTDKTRAMTFRDSLGKTCRVQGQEVFKYPDGEAVFKYTDAALKTWLKTRCPTLTPGW